MIIRNPELYEAVPCSICGEEYERKRMEKLFTGVKTLLLCPTCYRRGTSEIYEMRGERIQRANKHKRKK